MNIARRPVRILAARPAHAEPACRWRAK